MEGRQYVHMELRHALELKKPVILVHEDDDRFGRFDFRAWKKNAPVDLRALIDSIESLPFRRRGYERQGLMQQIIQRGGYALAYAASRPQEQLLGDVEAEREPSWFGGKPAKGAKKKKRRKKRARRRNSKKEDGDGTYLAIEPSPEATAPAGEGQAAGTAHPGRKQEERGTRAEDGGGAGAAGREAAPGIPQASSTWRGEAGEGAMRASAWQGGKARGS